MRVGGRLGVSTVYWKVDVYCKEWHEKKAGGSLDGRVEVRWGAVGRGRAWRRRWCWAVRRGQERNGSSSRLVVEGWRREGIES